MIRTQSNTRGAARGETVSAAHAAARNLARDIEHLARELLGEPRLKTRTLWRWGAHGSLAVNVAGPRRGRWYSFEDKRGGDALDLVAWAKRADMAAALAFARRWLGDAR